jgi:DNA-binding transcriptional MerR regulator
MAEPGAAHLSIGEVLALLLEEFPDVTISKIRFLESQGLIEPERTPSGYRKFFDDDVELLRMILREQREKFLPLRVIKHRIDTGEIERPDSTPARGLVDGRPSAANVAKHPAGGSTPRPSTTVATVDPAPAPAPPPAAAPSAPAAAVAPAPVAPPAAAPPVVAAAPAPAAPSTPSGSGTRLLPGVLVNREELCAMASVTKDQLAQLEDYGVLPKRSGNDLYGEEAVEIASAAGGFLRAGVDARHLRAWRTSVEREAGLYEQLIVPMLRQRNPQARSEAATRLAELDVLGTRLRTAMMRAALGHYFE